MEKSMSLFIDEKIPSFKALRASREFVVGEVLIDLKDAEELPAPDYTTIDLSVRHVYHPTGRYINHSCNPSARIDKERLAVVAIRRIVPDDEITFNYLTTERKIVAPFDCMCGADNCVGRVGK